MGTALNVPTILLSSRRHPVFQPTCRIVTGPSFVDNCDIFPPKHGNEKYKHPFGTYTSLFVCDFRDA